jgi:hypothetical protein
MLTFDTFEQLAAHIQALPGYIPSLKATNDHVEETAAGVTNYGTFYTYLQEFGASSAHKMRRCFVVLRTDAEGAPLNWKLSLPALSETPEGHSKVVGGFSSPDEFYPWVFSIWGHMARDGSDATEVRADGSPAQQGDADADLYFKKSFDAVLPYEIGFQNIVACWARFNEGDCCDVFVDVPGYFVGSQADWVQFAQFGEDITLFGSNPGGTHYPPTQNPALSFIPPGARIRVDVYKKKIDDPWFRLGANETEATNPEKTGPFLDLDILGQRRR